MSQVDAKYAAKFDEITKLNFVEQGKYWLNAMWKAFASDPATSEEVWVFAQRMGEMNKEKGKEGSDIDEFEAHKFLESFGETLTVIELREKLRSIDINNDKRMALCEYLLFKYPQGTMETLCESIQSDDDPEVKEAQRLVVEAQAAFVLAQENTEAARVARKEAEAAEAAAKVAADKAKEDFDASDAKRVDAESKAAEADKAKKDAEAVEDELRAALDNLKKQEEDHAKKISELEAVAGQPGVKGGQAAAELLKLKNEDPLPLRKAQAEQKVVVKKAEKVRAAAAAAAEVAAAAAAEAKAAADAAAASAEAAKKALEDSEAATVAATEAEKTAEESAAKAEAALQEAQDNVAKLKEKSSSQGAIWWMERDMKEMEKFAKPKRK